MRKTRAVCAVLGTLLLIPVSGPAWGQDSLRVTQPVQVTEFDLSPTRTYGAPRMAVDPGNPMRIVASFAEMRTRRCGLARSVDGGQTWTEVSSSPSLPAYPFCFVASRKAPQTAVAFGRDGTLYYALLGWDEEDGGPGGNLSVFLARSDDFGDSWATSVVRDARGLPPDDSEQNRPLAGLAVDTTHGDQDVVYIAWVQRPKNRSSPFLPLAAVSTDGGRTFSEPINLVGDTFMAPEARAEALKTTTTTTPAPGGGRPAPSARLQETATEPDDVVNFGGLVSGVTIESSGTAYFIWTTITANINPPPDDAIYLTRTSDQGQTFDTAQVVPFSRINPGKHFSGSFSTPDLAWSAAGGAEGTLHLVAQGTDRPDVARESDVHYRNSTDGGTTWSDPAVINDDDPTQLYYSGMPNISVAPDGRLDVAWWDTRSNRGVTANDVYYASSFDDGATWSDNVRVTDQPIDRTIGPWANNSDTNSAPGIVSTDALALIGWDDTRNGGQLGQAQDIYTAAVQHEPVSASSSTMRYLLAAVVGVTVGSAIFLTLALISGRRRA